MAIKKTEFLPDKLLNKLNPLKTLSYITLEGVKIIRRLPRLSHSTTFSLEQTLEEVFASKDEQPNVTPPILIEVIDDKDAHKLLIRAKWPDEKSRRYYSKRAHWDDSDACIFIHQALATEKDTSITIEATLIKRGASASGFLNRTLGPFGKRLFDSTTFSATRKATYIDNISEEYWIEVQDYLKKKFKQVTR